MQIFILMLTFSVVLTPPPLFSPRLRRFPFRRRRRRRVYPSPPVWPVWDNFWKCLCEKFSFKRGINILELFGCHWKTTLSSKKLFLVTFGPLLKKWVLLFISASGHTAHLPLSPSAPAPALMTWKSPFVRICSLIVDANSFMLNLTNLFHFHLIEKVSFFNPFVWQCLH